MVQIINDTQWGVHILLVNLLHDKVWRVGGSDGRGVVVVGNKWALPWPRVSVWVSIFGVVGGDHKQEMMVVVYLFIYYYEYYTASLCVPINPCIIWKGNEVRGEKEKWGGGA